MKKAFIIGLKDLQVIFRDRAALIMMLVAPYLLTLGMGFATGSFSSDDDGGVGIRNIGIAIVNEDEGELGANLVTVLQGDDFGDLFAITAFTSEAEARQQVEADSASAAVLIPADFSSIVTNQSQSEAKIEIVVNPTTPISAGIIQSVVSEYVEQVQAQGLLIGATISQMLNSGMMSPEEAQEAVATMSQQNLAFSNSINLVTDSADSESSETAADSFNPLAILTPGMALFFLMYTVSLSGRNILEERSDGTLARLLATPTTTAQLLGGKVIGIFLTGVVQTGILVVASTLMLGVRWGDPVLVVALVFAAAFGATGWGILLAAFARTPAQVTTIGSALMLLFGLLSGMFVSVGSGIAYYISRITPNAWALDGFVELSTGIAPDVLPNILALLAMGIALFAISITAFRRQIAY